MRGTVLHAPGDVRWEERPDPVVVEPTDAVVRTVAACVCGSDLWPYRGLDAVKAPRAIGHEYVGVVEEIGAAVTTVRPGQFVIGGFLYSDNTCPNCRAGVQSACLNGGGYDGCQAELIRVPQADGTLVATPEEPAKDLIPSLLALSDVMSTGWWAAVCAGVAARHDGGGGRRRRGGAVRCAGGVAAGRRAGDRHEPAPAAAGAGPRVRRHRHRDRARRRGHRPRQGAHRGGRRGRRPGVRGHRRVHAAGAAVDPARRAGRLRRRPARRRAPGARDVLQPTWACAAARRRCGGSCRISWSGSGSATSSRAGSSTWSCRWNRSPTRTARWTSGGRSRCCCGPDRGDERGDGRVGRGAPAVRDPGAAADRERDQADARGWVSCGELRHQRDPLPGRDQAPARWRSRRRGGGPAA